MHVFLFMQTKINCSFRFYCKTNGIMLFFVKKNTLLLSILWCYHKKLQKCPTTNHLFIYLFILYFSCQIKHKFDHKKWLCECINIFRCHSECTKRNTLILTPDVNSHGLLLCISTDGNLRYIVLFRNALFGCNMI